jgi:hypothetical protein
MSAFCSEDELKALISIFKTEDAATAFCEKLGTIGKPESMDAADWTSAADRMDGITEGLNTFFLTSCGALVFIMHAGFAMVGKLPPGSIRNWLFEVPCKRLSCSFMYNGPAPVGALLLLS